MNYKSIILIVVLAVFTLSAHAQEITERWRWITVDHIESGSHQDIVPELFWTFYMDGEQPRMNFYYINPFTNVPSYGAEGVPYTRVGNAITIHDVRDGTWHILSDNGLNITMTDEEVIVTLRRMP